MTCLKRRSFHVFIDSDYEKPQHRLTRETQSNMDKSWSVPLLKEFEGLANDDLQSAWWQVRWKKSPPESMEIIAQTEHRIGRQLPAELRDVFVNFGCFFHRLDIDGFYLGYFNRPTCPPICGGLVEMIDCNWGWNESREEESFSFESIAQMNARYISFGHWEVDENSYEHFYFDELGHFGALKFDQDFRDEDAWQHLLELQRGYNRHKMTFQELIEPYLQKALPE